MKIVSYIGLFLMVVFGGDRLISLSAEKLIRRSHNRFVRMYEGEYPADILFLGNSRVDRNIAFDKVHDLTGKTCINLGLGGNHILISEALLKDFVERYGNPKLVVLELSHSTVRTDSMGEIGIFSYYSPNIHELAKTINPTYTSFESIFNSLRFNSPAFWRLSAEVFTEPPSRLLQNTIPPEILQEWENGGHAEMPIVDENMEALTRICAYTDSKKIPIRLLIGPYWKEFRKRIVNFEPWKARLQEAVGQHHIYDYSEAFSGNADLFNDEMHLNAVGANEFSQKLVTENVL